MIEYVSIGEYVFYLERGIENANEYLMQWCEQLRQYVQFVVYTREYAKVYDNLEDSMNAAIDYCIEHEILEDILRKNRSQVLGSLLEDFDKEKFEWTIRKEGYEPCVKI